MRGPRTSLGRRLRSRFGTDHGRTASAVFGEARGGISTRLCRDEEAETERQGQQARSRAPPAARRSRGVSRRLRPTPPGRALRIRHVGIRPAKGFPARCQGGRRARWHEGIPGPGPRPPDRSRGQLARRAGVRARSAGARAPSAEARVPSAPPGARTGARGQAAATPAYRRAKSARTGTCRTTRSSIRRRSTRRSTSTWTRR